MATAALENLRTKLFEDSEGSKFARLKDRLLKNHGQQERLAVLSMLVDYVRDEHGYAWNPVTQETITDWPAQYLV
ncbi:MULTISPECIES: hypothetical protein [unclassified Janthinobacterium]|uniref:hypothetical protein n=1 Tax=unclassified Janthinobacterium TaxID=2610881 RepID=UPI0016106D3C|nr:MULTISPECIES: hypothetical protein [unclassified Janthinobacterium]MBB5609421.1 hypothetical protein [Janthinobacterium sp. S3T4]MBB5614732.1 hypothetical protein [Janthinobacterium sp. S3M3]